MAAKGSADLIADLAAAVPVEVIGNLLAVPRAERGPLRAWSLAILGALEPVLGEGQRERGEQAVAEFLAYLVRLVADRRAHPGDPARDVPTRLIMGETHGDRLAEPELLHNVIFILNAGHETTTNLIGNGLFALMEWPEERARLLAHPERIRPAVEELLRFESSNQFGNRVTTRATAVGDRHRRGQSRPRRVPRSGPTGYHPRANRHLAFGSGAHICAGLNIAGLEGRVAVGRFLARFPAYRLNGTPVHGGRARFRGFLSIPVALA